MKRQKRKGNRLSPTFPTSLERVSVLYTAQADSGPLRATTADEDGNLTTRRNACPASRWTWPWLQRQRVLFVIAQVERVAATGTLDPRNVKVPGILVDYICVAEHPDRMMQTPITHFNPAFTGEIRIPMKNSAAPLPLDDKKVFTRRTAMEIHGGDKCNLALDARTGSQCAHGGGVDSQVTLISESGLIGEFLRREETLAPIITGGHVSPDRPLQLL